MEPDKIQQLRGKLLICSVCMEEFDDPRILPCHHTFCLKCIDDITQSSSVNAKTSLRCPICRKEAPIPSQGTHKLPTNFYIVSLKDELGAVAHGGVCHICGVTCSQFHCMDCDFGICRFCIHPHRLKTHLGRSRIVRLLSPKPSSLSLSSQLMCVIHSGEMLQMFCRTCQEAICIECSCSKSHKWHSFITMSERRQEMSVTVQKEIKDVTRELEHSRKAMSLLKACKETIVSSSNESIFNLNRIAAKSCETIMRLKSEIEREINSSAEVQINSMCGVEKKLQVYTDMLHKGQDFLTDLQETDICMETIESYNTFFTSIRETRNNYTSISVQLQQKSFVPSHAIKVRNVKFGTLKTQVLYGNFGFRKSKELIFSANKKTLQLQVPSQPWKMFAFLSTRTFLKISLFITSFFFFNHVLSKLSRNELQANELGIDVANVEKELFKVGEGLGDIIKRAFEDCFVPP